MNDENLGKNILILGDVGAGVSGLIKALLLSDSKHINLFVYDKVVEDCVPVNLPVSNNDLGIEALISGLDSLFSEKKDDSIFYIRSYLDNLSQTDLSFLDVNYKLPKYVIFLGDGSGDLRHLYKLNSYKSFK
jgi:hypothetical protein